MIPAAGTKAGEDDRLAILGRGRKSRAVKRADAHIDAVEQIDLAAVPAPYDPRGEGDLDQQEQADLAVCEAAVDVSLKAFVIAGKALTTIHRGRLYRGTGLTWDEYCPVRWGITGSHARRFMDGYAVVEAISPIGETKLNEAQARELYPVLKDHGVVAVKHFYGAITEESGRATAAQIKEERAALPRALGAPEDAGEAVRIARAKKLQQATAPPTTGPAQPADGGEKQPDDQQTLQGTIVDVDAVNTLARAVGSLRHVYDELGDGLITRALTADPGRAEGLLLEVGQYAKRVAHRAGRARANPGGE